MKGISGIRLRIQCAEVLNHAKILPIGSFLDQAPIQTTEADQDLKIYFAQRIGEILCGNSPMYVYKPAGRSPIGRCALCGGALSFEIQEVEEEKKPQDAPRRPSDGPRTRRRRFLTSSTIEPPERAR